MKMAPRWTLICAGLWMLLAPGRGQFPKEDQQRIVNLHNHHRSTVEPPAADMIHMKWSGELALIAKEYATKCIWEHNPDSQNIMGENLFITTGPLDIEKALSDWFMEHKHYSYDNNTCAENEMCGHYTQMVWAKTKEVGCGSHFCETVETLGFKDATLLVCNYLPLGNYMGQKPYQVGEQCSKCPDDLKNCVDQACDSTDPDEPTVSPTEQWMTVIPYNMPAESDVVQNRFSDRDELPSVMPTEWMTELYYTEMYYTESSSGRPSASSLILVGLLASLLLL
ncbi:peptidase inhibitor 16 isoform X1 [Astyanax mexicanus]|uniref:Peptidase inhibitor 16 isoform X1 n=1 Tax=Astyanax mexicanus TaxID=7994 RepID=A0A8T2LCX1_ASTMX|nr:peptidase inhibitor 16 isoform X1 [Astyanax mexicanus]